MSDGGNHLVKEECIAVAGERNQVRKRITEKKRIATGICFLKKKIVTGVRGIFRTLSNIYDSTLL